MNNVEMPLSCWRKLDSSGRIIQALKDTEKGKNIGWRDLYRQAAVAFRIGGDDPDRAEQVYKEMNAPDVQPFIDAENKATAKAKRDYALKEAEDELIQANIIYNAIKWQNRIWLLLNAASW